MFKIQQDIDGLGMLNASVLQNLSIYSAELVSNQELRCIVLTHSRFERKWALIRILGEGNAIFLFGLPLYVKCGW